jgi:hypothetical protein
VFGTKFVVFVVWDTIRGVDWRSQFKAQEERAMAITTPRPVSPPTAQGFKYVRLVGHLLQRLHGAATERDRAGNRQLFYDQYAALLLLYFFTPTVTSLRGLHQVTTL